MRVPRLIVAYEEQILRLQGSGNMVIYGRISGRLSQDATA
jgi:hypothetical protein